MYVMERSTVIPLSLEDAWELFNGNELRDLVEVSEAIVEVRDYRMRDDGTPEYVMVNKAGPMKFSHRSDYIEYERPHRTVDLVLDSSLGGRFIAEHEAVEGGTRVTQRWEIEPRGLMRLLFPLMRSGMTRGFQEDLDAVAARVAERTTSP